MARTFPDTMASPDVYARLGLDSKNPRDKKIASRVMKSAGFVARRGRRWALWEKSAEVDSTRRDVVTPSPLSNPLSHHIDTATFTAESKT